PESWATDRRRRRAAGVPDALTFQPKWQIALAQIRTVQAEGVPPAPVVADAGYGDTTPFREALTAAGLTYVVGVKKETTAWTRGAMRSRFARLRVRPAHRDESRTEPRADEWLLIEWPRGDAEPTKYWLSTLPVTTSFPALVRLAKLRWRIERDYQELKDELGL